MFTVAVGTSDRRAAVSRCAPLDRQHVCWTGQRITRARFARPLVFGTGLRYWSSVFGPLRTETAQLDRFDVLRQITAARWTDVPMATVNMLGFGIQALFFGDFLLGQQKKVTRPPGRDPACSARTNG